MTIIGKVITVILSIFKNNWQGYLLTFWKLVPIEVKPKLLKIVNLINLVKGFADLTLWDALVLATETEKDDKVLLWLRQTSDYITDKYGNGKVLVKDLNKGDLQTLATEFTVASTQLDFGVAAMSIESAYQNS